MFEQPENWQNGKGYFDMAEIQNILLWIQSWFLAQCNGDWEHSYGVKIDTLDNPGWSVVIDLTGTALENVSMTPVVNNRTEDDWVNCSIVEQQFKGYCGPENLSEVLQIFQNFAENGELGLA